MNFINNIIVVPGFINSFTTIIYSINDSIAIPEKITYVIFIFDFNTVLILIIQFINDFIVIPVLINIIDCNFIPILFYNFINVIVIQRLITLVINNFIFKYQYLHNKRLPSFDQSHHHRYHHHSNIDQ